MPLLPTRWSSADARWKSMSQTYSRNWDYRRRRLTTDECLQCFVMSSLRACLLNPDLLRGAETTTGYVVVLGSTTNTTVVLRLAGRRLDHRSRRPGFKRHTLESLTDRDFGRVDFLVGLLAERAETLSEPYTRHLDGKVRELLFHLLRQQTRVTYWLAPARRVSC